MTVAEKHLAREYAKNRSRENFYKYLTSYGWSEQEVNAMWEYTQEIKLTTKSVKQGVI